MQFGKIKPVATIVAQFAAGVETEAIQHEGKLFLPVTTLGTFATKESAPVSTDEVEEEEETTSSKPRETSSKKPITKSYDEDDLIDMDVKELKGILSDLEIDPNDFDGKNTNKKLRKLILDAQKGAGTTEDEDEEDEDEDEAPKKKSAKKAKKEVEDEEDDEEEDSEKSSGSVTSKVEEILDDYDGGKINTKKATAKLAELLSAEPTKVGKLLDAFDDDDEETITDWSKKFVKKLAKTDDDEEEDDDEKPAKKSKKKAKKVEEDEDDEDEDLVEISELKKGDRVNVFWADEDNNEWYKGTVKSVKGSKVTVAYDDDTEDALDPEVNTKIQLLDEE